MLSGMKNDINSKVIWTDHKTPLIVHKETWIFKI